MNTILNTRSRLGTSNAICFALKLSLTLLVLVGGMANAADDYQLGEGQLNSKASNSRELNVAPHFTFETFRTMTIDITVVNSAGAPLSGVIALISDVPKDVTDLADQRLEKKALVSVVRTDDYGRVYQDIEVSNSISKILLELNIQSENNKVIIALNDKQHISHFFEID
jgi:hypothetical protein